MPSREALRERAAAVVEIALDRLLEHGRRGKMAPLWDTALDETDARLRSLEASAGACMHLIMLFASADSRRCAIFSTQSTYFFVDVA